MKKLPPKPWLSPRAWFMACGLGTAAGVAATARRFKIPVSGAMTLIFGKDSVPPKLPDNHVGDWIMDHGKS